jgi:ribokinase
MTAATERYDILGLGCTAVDDLLFVEGYPPADGKTRVLKRERQGGGLTATALVAAARMGARCLYAGTLGDDELSRFVESRLRAEGIVVEQVRRQAGARPVHSVIVVDQKRGTRAIFFDLENAGRATPKWPDESVIRAARVLFVDPFGIAGMTRAALVAREAGIPVVADFERVPLEEGFAELAALVGHLIVSGEFAMQWTGRNNPAEAARALWLQQREGVVVTCGAEGCWFLGREDPDRPRLFPAFRVPVVDTTGCGDVFHGAYAAGLAQGLDFFDRLRLASAAAALKATQPGGQTGIPSRSAVEEFLKRS